MSLRHQRDPKTEFQSTAGQNVFPLPRDSGMFLSEPSPWLVSAPCKRRIAPPVGVIPNRVGSPSSFALQWAFRSTDAPPGIAAHTVPAILSETPTLETFDSAATFLSLTEICRGNKESAGKRRSGRSRVTKNHLTEIMIEAVWAAVKKKGSCFRAKHDSVWARLGPKKAIVAVATPNPQGRLAHHQTRGHFQRSRRRLPPQSKQGIQTQVLKKTGKPARV
jgi:hypothetical protein